MIHHNQSCRSLAYSGHCSCGLLVDITFHHPIHCNSTRCYRSITALVILLLVQATLFLSPSLSSTDSLSKHPLPLLHHCPSYPLACSGLCSCHHHCGLIHRPCKTGFLSTGRHFHGRRQQNVEEQRLLRNIWSCFSRKWALVGGWVGG
jgi:hypothetical protein